MRLNFDTFVLALLVAFRICSVQSDCNLLVAMSSSPFITLSDGQSPLVGSYLNEFYYPTKAFIDLNYTVFIGTPTGNVPYFDANSIKVDDFESKKDLQSALQYIGGLNSTLSNPISMSDARKRIKKGFFSAVFIPGGHALMQDLWNNDDLGSVLIDAHISRLPTFAVCHGPAALASANISLPWIYDGYNMTAFDVETDQQVESMLWSGVPMKFYAPTLLEDNGAIIHNGASGKPNVIHDQELHTGQNPQSAYPLAQWITANLGPCEE